MKWQAEDVPGTESFAPVGGLTGPTCRGTLRLTSHRQFSSQLQEFVESSKGSIEGTVTSPVQVLPTHKHVWSIDLEVSNMKKLLVIVLVLVPTLIGIRMASSSKIPKGIVPTEQQRQQRRQQKQEQSRAVYRGLLNPHSDKIPEIAATAKEDVRSEKEIGLPVFTPNSTATFNLKNFLSNRACDADAIVLGTVNGQTSRLTEDESFIYTINELRVETVLKNNSMQAIKSGEVISALRSGGTIQLNGRKIVAEFKGSKVLDPGQNYLLFLTFVPEKGLYVADNVSYQIKNEKIVKLTEQKLEPGLESGNNATSFISSVRAAVAMPCESVRGE